MITSSKKSDFDSAHAISKTDRKKRFRLPSVLPLLRKKRKNKNKKKKKMMVEPYLEQSFPSKRIQQNAKEEGKKGKTKGRVNKMESKDTPEDENASTPVSVGDGIELTNEDSSNNEQRVNNVQQKLQSIGPCLLKEEEEGSEYETTIAQDTIDQEDIDSETVCNERAVDSESTTIGERSSVDEEESTDFRLEKQDIDSESMVYDGQRGTVDVQDIIDPCLLTEDIKEMVVKGDINSESVIHNDSKVTADPCLVAKEMIEVSESESEVCNNVEESIEPGLVDINEEMVEEGDDITDSQEPTDPEIVEEDDIESESEVCNNVEESIEPGHANVNEEMVEEGDDIADSQESTDPGIVEEDDIESESESEVCNNVEESIEPGLANVNEEMVEEGDDIADSQELTDPEMVKEDDFESQSESEVQNEQNITDSQELTDLEMVNEGDSQSESEVYDQSSIMDSQESIDVEEEIENKIDDSDSDSVVYDKRIIVNEKSMDASLDKTEIESFTHSEKESVDIVYKIPKEIDLTPSQTFTIKLNLFNLFKCCH